MGHSVSRALGCALTACAAAACLFSAAPASGQQQFFLPDEEPPAAVEPLAAGQVKSAAEITFSGYQSLPGGRGILFVELTNPVAVEVKRTGQVIEYKLIGARVPLKNNRNPLLLRDFSSSASSAVLVPDKNAVRLVVTLREKVSPTHRMVERGKGAVLEIELPAPSPGQR